jgi:glycosidase
VLDGRGSAPSEHSQAELVEYDWFAIERDSGERALGAGVTLTQPLPENDGDALYMLEVRDARGARDRARVLIRVQDGAARVPDAAFAAPVDDAVVYGVLPPLFGAPPYALSGVRAALDRLEDLGVSVLWLAPVFATPPGDFGYAVTDYRAVRSDYGSAEDLATLVRDAHARGMRVLLDLPANDTSDRHPYFVQSEQYGRRSHYFPYYARDASGAPTFYFDWMHLPNLAYDNAEVGRFMLEASTYWVRAFGVDGYRVDAAWGVRRRSPAYWPTWSAELRRIAPGALLIAEGPARDPYYTERGFDAAYDWSDQIGQWAWRDVWQQSPGLVTRLHAEVARSLQGPRPSRVLRFLNNNDTGARFITRHGEAMTRVATAALLTLPGIPCLYSFDEYGAEYEPYQKLQPIALGEGEDEDLYGFHRTLIHLRRATPALRGSGFLPLAVDGTREIYAYLRYDTALSSVVLVVLHFGAGDERVTLAIPERFAAIRDARLRDALSSAVVHTHDGALALQLGSYEARVLQLDTSAVAHAQRGP